MATAPKNTKSKSNTKASAKAPAKAAVPARTGGEQRFWLLKSEPDAFSWDQQKARGPKGEPWTGVRNYLARNNMRAMRTGDLGFFYHSNIGLEIVGIVEIITEARPEPGDETGKWDCVQVKALCDVPRPVSLAQVKATPELAGMSLVTCMRLSVQPVTAAEWALVCRMGGVEMGKLRT